MKANGSNPPTTAGGISNMQTFQPAATTAAGDNYNQQGELMAANGTGRRKFETFMPSNPPSKPTEIASNGRNSK